MAVPADVFKRLNRVIMHGHQSIDDAIAEAYRLGELAGSTKTHTMNDVVYGVTAPIESLLHAEICEQVAESLEWLGKEPDYRALPGFGAFDQMSEGTKKALCEIAKKVRGLYCKPKQT